MSRGARDESPKNQWINVTSWPRALGCLARATIEQERDLLPLQESSPKLNDAKKGPRRAAVSSRKFDRLQDDLTGRCPGCRRIRLTVLRR
jgi:hypothetical protein